MPSVRNTICTLALATVTSGFRVEMAASGVIEASLHTQSANDPPWDEWWEATENINVVTITKQPKGSINKGVKFAVIEHKGTQKLDQIVIPSGSMINSDVSSLTIDKHTVQHKWTDPDLKKFCSTSYIGFITETGKRKPLAADGAKKWFGRLKMRVEMDEFNGMIGTGIGLGQKIKTHEYQFAGEAAFGTRPMLVRFNSQGVVCVQSRSLQHTNRRTQLFLTSKTLELLEGSYLGKRDDTQGDANFIVTQHAPTNSPYVGGRFSDDFTSWSVPAVFRNLREDQQQKPTPYSSHALQVMYAGIGGLLGRCGQMPMFFSYFTIANDGMAAVLTSRFGGDSVQQCIRTDPRPKEAFKALETPQCTAAEGSDAFQGMYLDNPLGKLFKMTYEAIFGPEKGSNWETKEVTRWQLGMSNEVTFLIADYKCNYNRKFSLETGMYTDCA